MLGRGEDGTVDEDREGRVGNVRGGVSEVVYFRVWCYIHGIANAGDEAF